MLNPATKKVLRKFGLIFGGYFLLIGLISVVCIFYFGDLTDPVIRREFLTQIQNMGILGWLAFLGIQFAQIVVAFIPGGPLELLAGVLYGTWGGLVTCLLGALVASSLIFIVVRKMGERLVNKLFATEDLEQFKFLENSRKLEIIIFIVFIIPGAPKDVLTYVAGLSKIKFSSFLLLSTLARTPAILVTTAAGNNLLGGNWLISVLLFALIALVGIVGIVAKDKIMAYFHHDSD